MAQLPGSCRERLIEMRSRKGLNQKTLSRELERRGYGFFDVSTISRAESGKTTRINMELIEALSRYYEVTADYLLGLTDVPDKKNYELCELGLSYEAALSLIRGEIDPDGLNLLMRCEGFRQLCSMAASYYSADRKTVYEDVRMLFPDLPDLFEDTELFGYSLSETEKRKLETDLSILREPEKLQKEAIMKQFELVTEELAENMKHRVDPERLSHDRNDLKRQLRMEIQKKRRQAGRRHISDEDMARLMARITAVHMGLADDEKRLFEQLFLTMMRNRSKKKDEKGRQRKIPSNAGRRALRPVQGEAG